MVAWMSLLFVLAAAVGAGLIKVVMGTLSRKEPEVEPLNCLISSTSTDDADKAQVIWNDKRTNYILSSSGKVYNSSSNDDCLKKLMDKEEAKDIDCLRMKRGLTFSGSELLRKFFEDSSRKPVVYIGLVHNYTARDRQGLKSLIKDGFQLKVWEGISRKVKPTEYINCFKQYLELLNEELSDHPDEEPPVYTEDKVAVVSCGEDSVNHILTNTGVLYRSTVEPPPVNNHPPLRTTQSVVEVLTSSKYDVNEIDTLWIKKAPKLTDVRLLQEHFKNMNRKPVIHIGHIHKYTGADRQGLKHLITDGFQLKVWERASGFVKPLYTHCLQEYLKLLYEETLTHPDTEPSNYTEKKVAVISCGEDRITHLLTNEGKMYRNNYELDWHAEVVLASGQDNPNNIKEMWIKNSPCYKCTKVLRGFFANSLTKPVIYVGSIYQRDDSDDQNGLLSLLDEGFKVKVWGTMNTLLYGADDIRSEEYLEELRRRVQNKCLKGGAAKQRLLFRSASIDSGDADVNCQASTVY